MRKRLSGEIKKLIESMFEEGMNLKEIARKTNTSYSAVQGLIKAKKEGFKSPKDYRKHLVKKRGFDSIYEYHTYLNNKRGFKSATSYHEQLAKQKGFGSLTEYYEHLARKKGFNSYTDYQKYLVKQRGFDSHKAYQEHLAKQRGFDSLQEYKKHRVKERQKRLKNKELSNLIDKRLEERGKPHHWLAEKLGISREAVRQYARGKSVPKKENLRKILSILEINNETLEKSISNYHSE